MKKLLLKLSTIIVNKTLNIPLKNTLLKTLQNTFGEEVKEKEEKLILDSVTVVDDDKAILRYKKGDFYYNQKINYRRGKIEPINISTIYV